MHFNIKSYLKNNHYYSAKHPQLGKITHGNLDLFVQSPCILHGWSKIEQGQRKI
jgi:hypothetical protein